jgi:hypothetical protein
MPIFRLSFYEIVAATFGVISGVLFVRIFGLQAKAYLAEIQAISSISLAISMMGIQYQIGKNEQIIHSKTYFFLALLGSSLTCAFQLISPNNIISESLLGLAIIHTFTVILFTFVQTRLISLIKPNKYFLLQAISPLILIFGSMLGFFVEFSYKIILFLSISGQLVFSIVYIKKFKNDESRLLIEDLNVVKRSAKYIPYNLLSVLPLSIGILMLQNLEAKAVIAIILSVNQFSLKIPRLLLQHSLKNHVNKHDYRHFSLFFWAVNLLMLVAAVWLIPILYGIKIEFIFKPLLIIIGSSFFLTKISGLDAILIKEDNLRELLMIKFFVFLFFVTLFFVIKIFVPEILALSYCLFFGRFLNYMFAIKYEKKITKV